MFEKPLTLGLIVGNRGFFPSHLCEDGRAIILKVLEEEGIQTIAISPDETPYGSVESLEEARKLANLFKAHAPTHPGRIDGRISAADHDQLAARVFANTQGLFPQESDTVDHAV